jgi:hypothetical protein
VEGMFLDKRSKDPGRVMIRSCQRIGPALVDLETMASWVGMTVG